MEHIISNDSTNNDEYISSEQVCPVEIKSDIEMKSTNQIYDIPQIQEDIELGNELLTNKKTTTYFQMFRTGIYDFISGNTIVRIYNYLRYIK